MTQIQIIPGDFTITDTNVPVYPLHRPITSDDFSGTGEIVGSLTSAAMGGKPMMWEGNAGTWTRASGGAIPTPEGPYGSIDLEGFEDGTTAHVTIGSMPADQYKWFVIAFGVSTTSRVVARLRGDGSILIQQDLDGTRTDLGTTGAVFAADDRVSFGVRGGVATASVNGVPKLSVPTTVPDTSRLMLSYYPAAGTGRIDDVLVTRQIT